MGKLSRTKGVQFEREVANEFKRFYHDARRQLEYNEKDANGVDLQSVGPFNIQCKRGRKYANPARIEEIRAKEGVPLLVTKGDQKRVMVCLFLDDFLRLLNGEIKLYSEEDF